MLMHLFAGTLVDIFGVVSSAFILRSVIRVIPFPFADITADSMRQANDVDAAVLTTVLVMGFFTFRDKLHIYQALWNQNSLRITLLCGTVVACLLALNIPRAIIMRAKSERST
jgi:uncharacterized membrane protein